MGLFKKINSVENHFLLGVWKIEESLEELFNLCELTTAETSELVCRKSEVAKKQWLATRLLLKNLTGQKQIIKYDVNGKPALEWNTFNHISISHSKEMVGVLLSSNACGIDLEKVSERILGIGHKFTTPAEHNNEITARKLTCIWAAKESLYKLYGLRNIDFIQNLRIVPFQFTNMGNLSQALIIKGKEKIYTIDYENIGEFVLAFVTE